MRALHIEIFPRFVKSEKNYDLIVNEIKLHKIIQLHIVQDFMFLIQNNYRFRNYDFFKSVFNITNQAKKNNLYRI